jgi:hypothetical protein
MQTKPKILFAYTLRQRYIVLMQLDRIHKQVMDSYAMTYLCYTTLNNTTGPCIYVVHLISKFSPVIGDILQVFISTASLPLLLI